MTSWYGLEWILTWGSRHGTHFFCKMLVFGRERHHVFIKRIDNLLTSPRKFVTFLAEIGFIDKFRLCLPRLLIPFKKSGTIPQSKRNTTVLYSQVSKQYISYFHDNYCF